MKGSKVISCLKEMQDWVEELYQQLPSKAVILLHGPLGAGKTQFVQFLSRQASSPTFVLHQRYSSEKGEIDHVDLYRLESEEDLESMGFWDLFSKPQGYICVEWPERLPQNSLPPDWPRLEVFLDPVEPYPSRKVKWELRLHGGM
ncbi:MAG: tRNA (adenosine(37)-N6)-threonylcarbamoyltransferase complex ATPase subunit type 1 TsaE [Bdellovibrio sp.]|nr:MAG: tRNA (adenosine(37)-N6)-threonylcarbamoyltransferase complex ATPase subunit type 1 TsaE [Bdellovibrio sp.]